MAKIEDNEIHKFEERLKKECNMAEFIEKFLEYHEAKEDYLLKKYPDLMEYITYWLAAIRKSIIEVGVAAKIVSDMNEKISAMCEHQMATKH